MRPKRAPSFAYLYAQGTNKVVEEPIGNEYPIVKYIEILSNILVSIILKLNLVILNISK